MRGTSTWGGALLVIFLLGGCAAVKTNEEWGRVEEIAQERVGHEVIWERSEEEKRTIQEEVARILADGLSRRDAVQIAITNNRRLQSTFENLGISKSDLVQAGLFTNPSLDVLFRFPSGGGGTNIEAGLFFSISDLWQIPLRKKVAAAQVEATIMDVGQIILDTVAEAKRAYDTVYYLSENKTESERILGKFREISDRTAMRRDFGLTSDQDVLLAQIMVFEAELEMTRVERELAVAWAHLNRILGLELSRADFMSIEKAPETPRDLPDVKGSIHYALEHRLDVRMARFRIYQAEWSLDLEKKRVFRHLDLGVAYERETDGTDLLGPAVDIQLPLFDQNQAQISKAQYRVRRAKKTLEALEGQVREEVTKDLERIHLFQTRKTHFQEKIIPLRRELLDYADQWVNVMQLNRLYLLEAQKGLLESHREHLQTEMQFQHALTDLERHLGGRLPGDH
jgi:cobalt-zinc-cadmium efflux system outer membrane protein